MVELSLSIPCYNEEGTVRDVAKRLTSEFDKEKIDYELILVDNGSRDKTQEKIKQLSKENPCIKLAVVKVNIGYGFGITTGLKQSKGEYIGYAWADDQVPVGKVTEVFKKLKKEKLDLCKARRITRHDGPYRKFQSGVYNLLFRTLFSVKAKDINGCPKIMTRETFKLVSPKSKDWFIDAEIMIKASRARKRIGDVSAIFNKREKGASNVNLATSFEFLRNMFQYRFFKKLE